MDEISVVLTALCQSCWLHTAFYSNPRLKHPNQTHDKVVCRYCGEDTLHLEKVEINLRSDLYEGLIWGEFQRMTKEPEWKIHNWATTTEG